MGVFFKKKKYYPGLIYERDFNEYSSEHATLEKDIMKIFNENDLTYSLRQRKSQTNIVQSSSSANGNPNREFLCKSDNGSCYIMHQQRVKK